MALNRDVFINCPYDAAYQDLFQAISFTLLSCGYRPRCAAESTGSDTSRLEKILQIIQECAFGIHDISRIELSRNGLPRFNMPFELGLFMACKRFGGAAHRNKRILILDRDPHTHHASLSDLSGYDPEPHDGTPHGVIRVVNAWLRAVTRRALPGPAQIHDDFELFRHDLPGIAAPMGFDERALTFANLLHFQFVWIREAGISGVS